MADDLGSNLHSDILSKGVFSKIYIFVVEYTLRTNPFIEVYGTEVNEMKYAAALKEIGSNTFSRQDVRDALLKMYSDYNVNSFNRHFSKLISHSIVESVGENLYVIASPDAAKGTYAYNVPSTELSDVESFMIEEFPSADFLVWETGQLNEFLDHLIAHNMIMVMVERELMNTVFECMKEKFPSVLLSPRQSDIQRYGTDRTIVVSRLSSRYPKNPKQRHGYSIEKLTVDMFAERMMKALVNTNDRPGALETAFRRHRINETKLFNYARTRRVDEEIRIAIGTAGIKLYTDEGSRQYAEED